MFILSLLKISSILLAIVGTSFIIPIGVALACGENSVLLAFIIPMIASWILLLCVNLPTRKIKFTLSSRHAFVVVALAWAITSLMGSIPLYFSGYFFLSIFEIFIKINSDIIIFVYYIIFI